MILRQLRSLQRPVALRASPVRMVQPAGLRAPLAARQTRSFGTGERKQVMAVECMSAGAAYEAPPPFTAQPFDGSKPLLIPRFEAQTLTKRTSTSTSLAGNIHDLWPYFLACLAAGKLDRAELTLIRLEGLLDGQLQQEFLGLHNRYLRACIERMEQTPDKYLAEDLHKWYETRIRGPGLPQTVETIACMVKISLLSTSHGLMRRTSLVKRYMDLAPGDAGYAVLFHEDIINDEDLTAVLKICPDYKITIDKEDPVDGEVGEVDAPVDVSAHLLGTADPNNVATPFSVRETPQKGVGLSTLKKALHLIDSMKAGLKVSELPEKEQLELQKRLELESIDAAVQRWRDEFDHLRDVGAATATASPGMRSRLYEWHIALEAELKKEIELCDLAEKAKTKTQEDHDRCAYGPFLKQGSVSRLAAVTMLSVLNLAVSSQAIDRGIPIIQLVPKIGASIEDDIRSQLAKEHERKVARARRRMLRSPDLVTPADVELIKKDDDAKAAYRARMAAARRKVLGRSTAEKPKEGVQEGMQEGQSAAACHEEAGEGKPAAAEDPSEAAAAQFEAEAERLVAEVAGAPSEQPSEQPAPDPAAPAADTAATESELQPPPEEMAPIVGFAWTMKIRTKVGAAALTALINTAEMKVVAQNDEGFLVSEMHPVFQHSLQLRKGRKIGFLLFHPELCRILRSEPNGDFLAKHLPMLVKPRPWTGLESGGFLATNNALVRFKHGDRDQRIYTEAALGRQDMESVLAGLDVLGKTAWRINQPLFEVMVQAWNTGEEIANFPALGAKVPIPPEPDSEEVSIRAKWMASVSKAKGEEMGMHSVRCSINFQLEIARAFRDQAIYFPHNVDFRGRAYPMPTYLNHMGADHVRALLVFAEGKPLGKRGLQWLKVHLANVYGYDKASLLERESFATDNLTNIFDSVEHPLGGKRWWLQAEDPWQCLSTCMELKAALSLDNPEEYISHLPVHQDGTCNGLQHYAALGGDEWGARQVNLEPGERPADVYTAVADLVREQVKHDAAQDTDTAKFAKAVDGKVTRKVVKQTVMTNVYGVTFSGARSQVRRQLDDLYPKLEEETGIPTSVLSYYIATLVFSAMGNMFRGAHDIQAWLGDIGGRVCLALTPDQIRRIERGITTSDNLTIHKKPTTSKALAQAKRDEEELPNEFQTSIVWTTPLRMPVSQPYRKSRVQLIETCLQDLQFQTPDRTDPVNRRKQLQAFPPNFIHSLDASHMLLSALNCDRLGLTFAAVHDSFWTHACDIDTMNKVLREAFVSIHSEPVIARLAEEFKARYDGALYHARIDEESQAAKAIKAWRRQNKDSTGKEELLLEYRRQALLRSNDEERVAKGKAMVTPASIYESFKDQGAEAGGLAREDELEGTRLGFISEQGSANDEAAQDVASMSRSSMPAAEVFDAAQESPVAAASSEGATSEDPVAAAAGLLQQASQRALPGAQRRLESSGKSSFNEKIVRNAPAPHYRYKTYLRVWLPIEFPPVPAKGDFDVTRLLESQYFFS